MEIKNGKINILQRLPSLSDLTGARLVKINISEKDDLLSIQNMVYDGTTYGFTREGKIYLNSDVMNSNAAVHSEEFISKFGDWEKVSRLKNLLKNLQSLSVILSKRFFIWVCPDNSVENSRQKANNGRKLNYEKQNYYFWARKTAYSCGI